MRAQATVGADLRAARAHVLHEPGPPGGRALPEAASSRGVEGQPMRPFAGGGHKAFPHGIHPDVFPCFGQFFGIPDAVVEEIPLPSDAFAPGEESFPVSERG